MTDWGLLFIAVGLWLLGNGVDSGLSAIGSGLEEIAEALREGEHAEYENECG